MNASYRNEQHEELHESPLLNTTCRYPAGSYQMNRKHETASTVLSQYLGISTAYKYDANGHLTEASMPTCYEDYAYNSTGQRISMLHTRKGVFHYTYDAQGKLAQMNDTRFLYDHLGRLSGISAPNIPTKRFVYDRVKIGDLEVDRLASFQDSTGKSYIYNYTPKNPLPVAVHSYGQPVVTYQWDENGALPRLLVCATPFATWNFEYLLENDGRLPDTVILTGPVVSQLGYWDLKSLKCKLGYDHLGMVKLIADPFNELVKELFYDSFGNIVSETEQRIYFPLGFAGGLRDIATGFVSFGYRDYDPTVGRFTTPDPALDLRGDGDIYDYCVDDPVNLVDENGLAYKSANIDPIKKHETPKQKQRREKQEGRDAQRATKKIKQGVKNGLGLLRTGNEELDEVLDKAQAGYDLGSIIAGPFGGAIGAAIGVNTSTASKKIRSNAIENNIDISDSTSIFIDVSGIEADSKYEIKSGATPNGINKVVESTTLGVRRSLGKGMQGKVFWKGASCTPATQPRTPDGRFASCGHAQ